MANFPLYSSSRTLQENIFQFVEGKEFSTIFKNEEK